MSPKGGDSLFDLAESRRRRDEGKSLAAENRKTLLQKAREIAKHLAIRNGTVTADDVGREMLTLYGCTTSALGPSAGSLFSGPEWEWTGDRTQSAKASNHARELKVWRLKGEWQ